MITTNSGQHFFNGIIQQMRMWTNPLGKYQIHDQATCKDSLSYLISYIDKCQPYCKLCKVADMPMCVQQYDRSTFGYYDFSPPDYFYSTTNPDISGNANPMNVMGTIGTWTGAVDDGLNPIHVDR